MCWPAGAPSWFAAISSSVTSSCGAVLSLKLSASTQSGFASALASKASG